MVFKRILGEYADSNTFVFKNNISKEAAIVDAGACINDIVAELESYKLTGIYLTHGHFDHINNLHLILDKYGYDTPIYLHAKCKEKLFDSKKNLSEMFGLHYQLDKTKTYNFRVVNEGDNVEILGKQFGVYNFLGHSACSLAFLGEGLFIIGDVLFESGIGRYDLEPNGQSDSLNTLYRLQEIGGYHTVLSGHGPNSSAERQARNIDAFIRFLSR